MDMLGVLTDDRHELGRARGLDPCRIAVRSRKCYTKLWCGQTRRIKMYLRDSMQQSRRASLCGFQVTSHPKTLTNHNASVTMDRGYAGLDVYRTTMLRHPILCLGVARMLVASLPSLLPFFLFVFLAFSDPRIV
jgi:hypothetical protein